MPVQLNSETCSTRIERREISFSWKIENLSLCNDGPMEYFESQVFPKSEENTCRWRLRVYPYGCYDTITGFVSACLDFVAGEQKGTTANYTLSFKNNNGKILHSREFKSFKFTISTLNHTSNHLLSLSRDEAIRDLTDNVLIVNCLLQWNTYVKKTYDETKITNVIDVHKNLSNDLSQLMINGSFSDVILSSKDDVEFSAHKGILAIRSPVFSAMFEHDMKEKQESIVKIEDVNADVLKCVLEFLYSGRFNNDKCDMEELLYAAIKYDIRDLKVLCEHEFGTRIEVENAADLLFLADEYDCDILKARVLGFIMTNLRDVVGTEAMKNLSLSRPALYYKILKALARNTPN